MTTLRRLFSEQLLHVGLHVEPTHDWVDVLTWLSEEHGKTTMPSIRSFRCIREHCSDLSELSMFPSLTHADAGCGGTWDGSRASLGSLPMLSSLRLDPRRIVLPREVQCTPLHTLILSSTDMEQESVELILNRFSGLRHFAAVAGVRDGRPSTDRWLNIFRILERPFANLTYLQLDAALDIAHWRYLLTPATPPPFAATLTHLLVLCYGNVIDLLAHLLANLPLMCRALERCHIDMLINPHQRVTTQQDYKWYAAIQELEVALGAVWCENAGTVEAYRSDMVRRREAGVQYQESWRITP